MRAIAIAQEQLLFYEGDGVRGFGLWPPPVVTIATVLVKQEDEIRIPSSINLYAHPLLLFREDSFDPVTRIRRGRLYESLPTQPNQWFVQPHPAYTEEVGFRRDQAGWLQKDLHGFRAWSAWEQLPKDLRFPLLALGALNAFTLWRIVDVERTVSGEDLLTLRARGALGILPELNEIAIPEDARSRVLETISKLSDAAYRAGPESVIDRARDVAQWCLGVWLAVKRDNAKWRLEDLGSLAKNVPDDRAVLKSVAHTIARLHSRGKPNEQERYRTRPLVEGDAEFALAAIGELLRELGWAK